MIKKTLFFFVFTCCFVFIKSQKRDSVLVSVELLANQELRVQQKIVYHNHLGTPVSKIKLLNWISSYKKYETPLYRRKLEEGDTKMHFADSQKLGRISGLTISIDGESFEDIEIQENIYLPLSKPLLKGESKEIVLDYILDLPASQFTSYGKSGEEFYLKYFFILPDSFEDENQSPKYFLDLEETQNVGSFWDIKFILPEGYFVKSNLKEGETKHSFQGVVNTDSEFYLSKVRTPSLFVDVGGKKINIDIAYPLQQSDLSNLEFYLPLHLKFINKSIAWLPDKIFITPKQKEKMGFLGNEDIKVLKMRLPLFSASEKNDLDYFSIVSYNVLENAFVSHRNEEHWLKHGIKTYLEIQYLEKFYKQYPLVGNIKNWSFWGMKPLQWLNASKLKLTERYGIAYRYAMKENIDQPIATKYDELTDYNRIAISHFEMGKLLHFVSEREGEHHFSKFLEFYIKKSQKKKYMYGFVEDLIFRFGDSYAFIRDFLVEKQRVDFDLKSVKKISKGRYELKVSKNTSRDIPLKLEVKNNQKESEVLWIDTTQKTTEAYQLRTENPEKLIINPNYSFPESNFRNNFSEKRWLGFAKKMKLKLFTDIHNPEYNEVYINPDLRYNIYDELLFGLDFSNSSLMSQPFSYFVTPYLGIGEGKLVGKAGVSYRIQPADAFFRRLVFGISGSYFHYDYNLSYRKVSFFSDLNFTKKPRSFIDKSIRLAYQYIDRDLSPSLQRRYPFYGLWSLSFQLKDRNPIHEKYITTNFQLMRDFQKYSLEGVYYWRFAPKKQMQFRFFGGVFFKNRAQNNVFNFGISKINDYNFTYSLLGQSAVSGLFAQEFILADGGFKSYMGDKANHWIMALNVDVPIWKVLSIYGDMGVYKNRGFVSNFIWDSGAKVSVIPSVLEVYFPLQSSLGFEPMLDDYSKRIRFSLNLNLDNLVRAVKKVMK